VKPQSVSLGKIVLLGLGVHVALGVGCSDVAQVVVGVGPTSVADVAVLTFFAAVPFDIMEEQQFVAIFLDDFSQALFKNVAGGKID
tara:strand:+ start:458 stop:715 length:258 start_codon:yes stop_codon:yes gene_type:complete